MDSKQIDESKVEEGENPQEVRQMTKEEYILHRINYAKNVAQSQINLFEVSEDEFDKATCEHFREILNVLNEVENYFKGD